MNGVISGYTSPEGEPLHLYGPADPVTYGQVIKMVLKIANYAPATDLTTLKNRSAKNDWSAPYIAKAEKLGVAVLRPDLDITTPARRADVVAIIESLLRLPQPARHAAATYRDVDARHPAAKAIEAATLAGIITGDTTINGDPAGTFRPFDSINRAEVAKVFSRLLDWKAAQR